MKITIIAPSSFGYIDFLIDKLKSIPNVEVTHINFSKFSFKYNSKYEKIKNAFNKILFNKNIKDMYVSQCILELLKNKEKQDIIVVVRPDKIELKTLKTLKLLTDKLYAFYFDALANIPNQIKLIPIFDKVFSYEKDDVKKYNLEFITNYIYDVEKPKTSKFQTKIFNILSYDSRFNELKSIAKYLKKNQIKYTILVRKERMMQDSLVTIIPEYLSLTEVKKLILDSEILLDIQKENQKGLSFRVFEALGYEKKLITTNKDIVNYDFYKSNNILVIDSSAIEIPCSFLNTPYEKIEDEILFPYTMESWIKKIFNV